MCAVESISSCWNSVGCSPAAHGGRLGMFLCKFRRSHCRSIPVYANCSENENSYRWSSSSNCCSNRARAVRWANEMLPREMRSTNWTVRGIFSTMLANERSEMRIVFFFWKTFDAWFSHAITSVNASFWIWLMRFSLKSKRRIPRTFLKACDRIVSNALWAIFKSSNSTPNSTKSSAASFAVVRRPNESERMFRILIGGRKILRN